MNINKVEEMFNVDNFDNIKINTFIQLNYKNIKFNVGNKAQRFH